MDHFDWRAREAKLNGHPHYLAEIGGRRVHLLHFRAASGVRLPLILSHGWPSGFVEMLPLAERLADEFDVVIPSLPGFLYSDLPDRPLTRTAIAQTLHALMTDVLGYQRYGAFGGDIGGAATAWLGALYPRQVAGIHMIHPPFPARFDGRPLSTAEQAFIDAEDEYDRTDGGYSAIMITRPDTIAAALIDSPAGLAAWIVDKYRDWSDCHGDVESRFDRDTLLTVVTLYWVTGSIGTSFRQYFDYEHNGPRPTITVPSAFTLSAEPSMANFPADGANMRGPKAAHQSTSHQTVVGASARPPTAAGSIVLGTSTISTSCTRATWSRAGTTGWCSAAVRLPWTDRPELVAFWVSGGRVPAGMNVNVWDVQEEIQALVRAGRSGPST